MSNFMNEVYNNKVILEFLKHAGLLIESNITSLDGQLIPREILLDKNKYLELKDDINKLKHIFSSSSMTSLQTTAETSQKWPLLNVVRQVLKNCRLIMVPVRSADGYDKDGKKKYKRYFKIQKLSINQNTENNLED